MYNSDTENQGNVELHLPDATNDVNEKSSFSSVFAKLEQDQGSYTISYHDDSNTVLQQNNIDILLGAAALQSNDNVNNFDIFENEIKQEPELNSSPKSLLKDIEHDDDFHNSTHHITNEDAASYSEDIKYYLENKSPSSNKRIKCKASSPNGWGPQQCSICSKIFGNTSALAKHKLTHSDERKYGCATCGKAFKRQDHLNGHMLTHRHKKPFECKADGCGKSYCDARSLRRHTENHHVHPSLPITTPTISVQEVISSTSNIPTCIHYAPKGTQSFQKNNSSSTAKLPISTTLTEKSIAVKTFSHVQSNLTEKREDKMNTSIGNTNIITNRQTLKDAKSMDYKSECKPVECNLCHRKFKNVPALNGHMRLHGGYFKKENDLKKSEKKESNGPHLTTASISVRALIEEKIIQKRSTALNTTAVAKLNQNHAAIKLKLTQNKIPSPKLKTNILSTQEEFKNNKINDYQTKISSFAIPAAPSHQIVPSINTPDILKRNNKEETYNSSIQEETLMFNELLLKRVPQKHVKRASSDPGSMPHSTQSRHTDVNFSPENTYLDMYHNQNEQYFPNNLTDEMFQNVQDTNSMLLHSVDTTNELNNLSQIQSSDFQEISLEEYQNDLQNHQDLHAVLNSPLPVSLTEFSYIQNDSVISNHESPLPSPSFTYPTPPASQERQSPSFYHVSSIAHHTQVSSPLSTAFYSSDMSSPGAVEAALNEVLPMDVNQNVYPSPSSPSPISVTPEPSPVSLSTPTFTSQTDIYHTQPQETDNSILSNQKDFVFHNNDGKETYKFIQNNRIYETTSQEYQNVILSCSKLTDNDSQYDPSDARSITLESKSDRNTMLRSSSRENITLYADDVADDRCNITFHSEIHESKVKVFTLKDDRNIAFHADTYDNNVNFQDNCNTNFNENGKDNLFYDKNITFHMEDRDITLYAENQDNMTLHSENQSHIVLHSDNKSNMMVQEREAILDFHVEENNNYEQRITFNTFNNHHCDNITLHVENAHYDQKLMFAPTVKDYGETFVIKTLPSISSNEINRKRNLNAEFKQKFPQKSRLRIHRYSSRMLHFTPCPMLNPLRNSNGLYWQALLSNATLSNPKEDDLGREIPKNELLIESDEDPHINIGPHFQANVEPYYKNLHPAKFTSHEDLVWEPAIKHGIMDNEIDMYLEFACCAALPGGGRNKEYALHILHLCQGNIHEAVLKLMQPKLHVPSDHPLLTYDYPENDTWNVDEIEIFQHSILQFDKNFVRVAQHIGTKTVKQCIQFYYLWKKACPEEYKRIRLNWRRIRERNIDKNMIIPVSNVNVANGVEIFAADIDTRPFACEFPDCFARFNSRAALNGHNRIHGGSVDRWRTVSSFNNNIKTCSSDITEIFPCKLCGKVFSKIKSRSAHMKSHRPSEMEPKKLKSESQKLEQITEHNNEIINSPLLKKFG